MGTTPLVVVTQADSLFVETLVSVVLCFG